MEKKNNSGMLVGILIGIVIAIIVVGGLFVTGTINFKQTANTGNKQTSKSTNNDNIEDTAKALGEKMYLNLYSFQTSWVFCGENMKWGNKEDYIQNPDFEYEYHMYDVSQDFKSINELNNYLKSYLTDELIKKYYQTESGIYEYKDGKYVNEIYLEKDGKLYCKNSNKDHGYVDYDKDNSTYNLVESNENSAVVTATIGYKAKGDETVVNIDKLQYEIVKSNNNWVLKSFINIAEGKVNIRSIESYLKDIKSYNELSPQHKIIVTYNGKDYTDSNMLSIIDNLDSTDVSTNGERWKSFNILYDNKGYISKLIIA